MADSINSGKEKVASNKSEKFTETIMTVFISQEILKGSI